MSLLSRLLGRNQQVQASDASSVGNPSSWLLQAVGGGPSASGVNVGPDSSLAQATVYSCVRVLTETVAMLPIHLYQAKSEDDRKKAVGHPLYKILHIRPNRWQTPFSFKEMMMGHALLRGNAYAQIVRDGAGDVQEIIPLHPDRVKVMIDSDDMPVYQVTFRSGRTVMMRADEVVHFHGLSSNGYVGVTPITLHRDTIGLALATQEFGSRLFSNGARPSGVIKFPKDSKPLSKEGFDRLKTSWEQAHGGLSNANKTAILEYGAEWQSLGMTSEDAQFLDTRKMQRTEICAIFRVPPHMVMELEFATFSNIEHQYIQFLIGGLGPWITRFEQALMRACLSTSEQDEGYYVNFNPDAILRGDTKSRYEAYSVATGGQPWMTQNEIRKKENMNPIDGGDELKAPLNMAVAKKTANGGSS